MHPLSSRAVTWHGDTAHAAPINTAPNKTSQTAELTVLRHFSRKKKMQREGLFREMKNRRAFEKPSERRAREEAESTRRVRKLMRKRMEREGY